MVDKVRPLKIESPSLGGTESDMFPSEVDPAEDYLASKGISFEGLDDYLAEKIGGTVDFKIPDGSLKVFYTGILISAVEIYQGATQTTPNRRVRTDFTYTGILVTQDATKIYSPSDGTTVLRTITTTYTYSGVQFQNSSEVTT